MNKLEFLASRRGLLAGGVGLIIGGGVATSVWAQPAFRTNPFPLGVAAGDPAADGFVIWTRLAPEPLEYGCGMAAGAVEVDWEVAATTGCGHRPQRQGLARQSSAIPSMSR